MGDDGKGGGTAPDDLPRPPDPEPSPDVLPPYFWLMLRGSEALRPPKHAVERPSKIVLLHGWLQDHTCWLKTAMKLRDTYGHDCLLLDFYGHGRSPYLPNFHHMNIYTCVRQLRELLDHAGWLQEPVVLAGISFGGGVAQHYALRYPDHVERMVLMASVGQPEPTWRAIPMLVRGSSALAKLALFTGPTVEDPELHRPPERPNLVTRIRGKLWMARKYPQHDLPHGIQNFLRRYPLTLVWGRYDTLHSPNLRRWLCKDDASPTAVPNEIPDGEEDEDGSQQEAQQVLLKLDQGDRPDDLSSSSSPFFGGGSEQASAGHTGGADGRNTAPRNDVNVLLVPMDHALFCVSVDSLRLHRYAHFWHEGSHNHPSHDIPSAPQGQQPRLQDVENKPNIPPPSDGPGMKEKLECSNYGAQQQDTRPVADNDAHKESLVPALSNSIRSRL